MKKIVFIITKANLNPHTILNIYSILAVISLLNRSQHDNNQYNRRPISFTDI